jgi:hypothetical protein
MKENPSEYIKLAVIFVVMSIVYIYVVHPILLDVAPFLAFQSSAGFERRSGGLGPYSLAATVVTGIFIYYLGIEYTVEVGFVPLLAVIGLTFLILIPNLFLPKRLYPENINDLKELEDRYKEKPGLIERLASYSRKNIRVEMDNY